MGGEGGVGRRRGRAAGHDRRRGERARARECRGGGAAEAGESVLGCVEAQRELARWKGRTIRAGKNGFMRQK